MKKVMPRGSNAGLFPQVHTATSLQYCLPNEKDKLYQITKRVVLLLEGLNKALQGQFTNGESNALCHRLRDDGPQIEVDKVYFLEYSWIYKE